MRGDFRLDARKKTSIKKLETQIIYGFRTFMLILTKRAELDL